MKKSLSILAPLIVIGFFATAPLTFAQPTVSIGYPANGQTFTNATIPGMYGTAAPGFFGPPLGYVEVWNATTGIYYPVKGTTEWDVDESVQLSTSPGSGNPVLNVIYAECFDTSGNNATTWVDVYYVPPVARPPLVSISAPTNGQTILTNPYMVSGTATDEGTLLTGISQVQVQTSQTSFYWQTANGTTNWSASMSLGLGANTISARSEDGAGLYSSIASVNVTCPVVLGAVAQNSEIILTWPANSWGILLECSSNLGPAAVWCTNTISPVIVGEQDVVTNPMTGSQMFYRLYISLPPF